MNHVWELEMYQWNNVSWKRIVQISIDYSFLNTYMYINKECENLEEQGLFL